MKAEPMKRRARHVFALFMIMFFALICFMAHLFLFRAEAIRAHEYNLRIERVAEQP